MQHFTDKHIGAWLAAFSSVGMMLGLGAILGIVPVKYVWGGRVTEHGQMIRYELVTLVANLFIIWIIAVRVRWLQQRVSARVMRSMLGSVAAVMLLNTLGNLLAHTTFEKTLAIPTGISALGFWTLYRRLPKDKQPGKV